MNEMTSIAESGRQTGLEFIELVINGGRPFDDQTEAPQRALTALDFPGGRLEVHDFGRNGAEEEWCSAEGEHYLLDMALSPRPEASVIEGRELGTIFMVMPGETVRLGMSGAKHSTLRCQLSARLIDPYLATAGVQGTAFDLGGGQIEWLLRRMYREMLASNIGLIQTLEGLAKQLSVEIVRRLRAADPAAVHRSGGLPPWRLRLIERRTREDAPMPSIEELAGACRISVRHLSRAFRSETGQALGKYIEAVMAERARALLTEGIPVGRVAHRLGYACTGNFAQAFRRATGLLPNEVKSQVTVATARPKSERMPAYA